MRNSLPSGDRAILPSGLKDPLAEREAMERHQDVFCVVAGVPCQDVSVAGKRAGLAGERTGLFYEFARILRELRPAWFVFENVPGLLSSNRGRDFAEVQRVLMVECGYGICWRVLNSQFFGVAQRRRRLFIVGSFGKPCPAEVLFDTESGEGDFAASGKAGTEAAGPLGGGAYGTGRRSEDDPNLAVTLSSGNGANSNNPGRRREDDFNLAYCLREDPGGIGQGHNVASTLNAEYSEKAYRGDGSENIFAIQDVRGHRDKKENGIGIDDSGVSYTIDKTSQHAVAFAENGRNELRLTDKCSPLTTGGGKPGRGYPAVAVNALSPVRRGADDNDAQANHLVRAEIDPDGMRGFARTAEGMDDPTFELIPKSFDSPRYRAIGNAVTVQVAEWIARRILRAATGNHG